MEDAIHYGAPTLTVEDVRALMARVADVVNERDQLRHEIHDLRLILGEIASLRAFLQDDGAAVAVPAWSNGHLAHGPTPPAQADDIPEPDDTTSEPGVAQADADPAASDRDETPDERQGETPAGDAAQAEPDDRDEPDTATPADDVPASETPADDANDASASPERPPEGTLKERILTAIEASDRPRRGWHLQKELNLPRVPTPELSRLVKRGFLTRHGESVYGIAGRKYGSSKSC
jgi:hypothetical protein